MTSGPLQLSFAPMAQTSRYATAREPTKGTDFVDQRFFRLSSIIRIFRALDRLSGVSGSKVTTKFPEFDQ